MLRSLLASLLPEASLTSRWWYHCGTGRPSSAWACGEFRLRAANPPRGSHGSRPGPRHPPPRQHGSLLGNPCVPESRRRAPPGGTPALRNRMSRQTSGPVIRARRGSPAAMKRLAGLHQFLSPHLVQFEASAGINIHGPALLRSGAHGGHLFGNLPARAKARVQHPRSFSTCNACS